MRLSVYNYMVIYPYLTYCNIAGLSMYVFDFNRICYLQKLAVLAMTNSGCQFHSDPLFSKLDVVHSFQVNSFPVTKFMFSYHLIGVNLNYRKTVVATDTISSREIFLLSGMFTWRDL